MELTKKLWLAIPGALLCAASSTVWAEAPSNADVSTRLNALEAQVANLKSENADLKEQVSDKTISAERAEEVKSLIRDVLADADTRASLEGSCAVAGNDGKFFIASQDGTFRLNIGAQIQVRYIANLRRTGSTGDATTSGAHQDGFQIRRVEPSLDGFIGSPKFEYLIILQEDRGSGAESTKIAQISYTFGDSGVRAYGGRIYDCFAREALMSSKKQQTVERSVVDNVFAANDDIVEGVGVEWKAIPEYLILNATYNDGFNSGTTIAAAATSVGNGPGSRDFSKGAADAAATVRAEVKLAGKWSQKDDVESWSTDSDLHAFLGAGFHFEDAKTGDKQAAGQFSVTPTGGSAVTVKYDQFYQWTADALVKWKGLGAMGAFYGWHFRNTNLGAGGTNQDLDMYAATAQVGYMVIPDKLEPFARYEWLFPDKHESTNELNIVTAGFNWFIKKHTAKFTLDAMAILNNVNAVNTLNTSLTGTGVLTDDVGPGATAKKGQVVIRAQFQLLF